MKQKKLCLSELRKGIIPTVTPEELLLFQNAKDGFIKKDDPEGCHLIAFAARYATKHNLDFLTFSSNRFGRNSTFKYCKKVLLINSAVYAVPQSITITSRTCTERNIIYVIISDLDFEECIAKKIAA